MRVFSYQSSYSSENAFGPMERGFLRLSLLRGCLPRCGQVFTDGWINLNALCTLKCAGDALSDESSKISKSEITFAGRAGLTTGILRQHSLAWRMQHWASHSLCIFLHILIK